MGLSIRPKATRQRKGIKYRICNMFSRDFIFRQMHGSSFDVIWVAATYPSALNRRDCMKVNVVQTCTEIIRHLTRDELEEDERPARLSLYISTQLTMGIMIIHRKLIRFLYDDVLQLFRRMYLIPQSAPIELPPPTAAQIARITLPEPRLEFDEIFLHIDEPLYESEIGTEEMQMQHLAQPEDITMMESLPLPRFPEEEEMELPEEDKLPDDWFKEPFPISEVHTPPTIIEAAVEQERIEIPLEELVEIPEVPPETQEITEAPTEVQEILEVPPEMQETQAPPEIQETPVQPERDVIPKSPKKRRRKELDVAEVEEERRPPRPRRTRIPVDVSSLTLPPVGEAPRPRQPRRKRKLIIDKKKKLSPQFMRTMMETANIELTLARELPEPKRGKVPAETLLTRPGSSILSKRLLMFWSKLKTSPEPNFPEPPGRLLQSEEEITTEEEVAVEQVERRIELTSEEEVPTIEAAPQETLPVPTEELPAEIPITEVPPVEVPVTEVLPQEEILLPPRSPPAPEEYFQEESIPGERREKTAEEILEVEKLREKSVAEDSAQEMAGVSGVTIMADSRSISEQTRMISGVSADIHLLPLEETLAPPSVEYDLRPSLIQPPEVADYTVSPRRTPPPPSPATTASGRYEAELMHLLRQKFSESEFPIQTTFWTIAPSVRQEIAKMFGKLLSLHQQKIVYLKQDDPEEDIFIEPGWNYHFYFTDTSMLISD